LAQTVQAELANLKTAGVYNGTFSPQYHSYGYEGRSCFPSAFDLTYCYVLGQNVAAMLALGCNGLISSVTNLSAPVSEWQCGGVPITMLCHMEKRHGHMKPVIKKALVELDGEPFKCFTSQRADWEIYDFYRSPGPIQFFTGATSVELCVTLTLELKKADPRMSLEDLTPVKLIQDSALKTNSFTNAPLVGAAGAILSVGQLSRTQFKPTLHPTLAAGVEATGVGIVSLTAATATKPVAKIGVVFAGAVAPGTHDVVGGILDALAPGSVLVGFVGGVKGLLSEDDVSVVEITAEKLALYRAQGGGELLGQSEDEIAEVSYAAIGTVVSKHALTGLVFLGGATTIENVVKINEYFSSVNIPTKVVAVPVDATGAASNTFVEVPVGFDSFTKTAAEIVGNNATDGASAKKYWYFERIMGGSTSHTTLEVALKTKSNVVLLAEEISAAGQSLADVINGLADIVVARSAAGKNFGTLLIPEGVILAIPEIAAVVDEVEKHIANSAGVSIDIASVEGLLSEPNKGVFSAMPDYIQAALIAPRTGSAGIDVAQLDTEKYLAFLVGNELSARKKAGLPSASCSVVPSYIGYQARGCAPSNFDVTLAYNLGHIAAVLVLSGFSGYVPTISNLTKDFADWTPGAVVASSVGPKSAVNLSGYAYASYLKIKEQCKLVDLYENPGPLQYLGPAALVDSVPLSLAPPASL